MTIIEDTEALVDKYWPGVQLNREGLQFRLDLLEEEAMEISVAFDQSDPAEFVDGLVDIVVVAMGTLQMCGVDLRQAWDQVFRANITKVVGQKPGRESPMGIDLTKPEGWVAPDHTDNTGCLPDIL